MGRSIRYPIKYYLGGSCWILVGFCRLFDNIFADIIRIALLLALVIIFAFYKDDISSYDQEEFEKAIARAKSTTVTIIYGILCVFSLLIPLAGELLEVSEWNWMFIMTCAFFAMMGIIDISTGVVFSKLIKREGK